MKAIIIVLGHRQTCARDLTLGFKVTIKKS
jgi:hypothetical protein